MKTNIAQIVHLVADEGKVLARKDTGEILGSSLWLGHEDSPDNYIDVDIPDEPEQNAIILARAKFLAGR